MSHATEACAFCNPESLAWRTIRSDKLCLSIVSRPWFRPGHCLVVPRRHITTVTEQTADEAAAVMAETGRLALALDEGYGSGVMQKFQPQQADNGIKLAHLHFHVFPRQPETAEPGLFPVPRPNGFDGFATPSDEEITGLARRLR